MARGFTVAQMHEILAHWDDATEVDLERMGFISSKEVPFGYPEAPVGYSQPRQHLSAVLLSFPNVRQSDPDKKRDIPKPPLV